MGYSITGSGSGGGSGGGGAGVYFRSGFVGSQTPGIYHTWQVNGGVMEAAQMTENISTGPNFLADNAGWVVVEETEFQGGHVSHINSGGGFGTDVIYEVWKLPAQTTAAARTVTKLGEVSFSDDGTANKNYNGAITLEPTGLDLAAGDMVAMTVRKTSSDGGAGARMSATLRW